MVAWFLAMGIGATIAAIAAGIVSSDSSPGEKLDVFVITQIVVIVIIFILAIGIWLSASITGGHWQLVYPTPTALPGR